MATTFFVNDDEKYGALNNINLYDLKVPLKCRKNFYNFKDGKYLSLKITELKTYCTKIWYVTIKYQTKIRSKTSHHVKVLAIGCLSEMSLTLARETCSKIINHIRNKNRILYSKRKIQVNRYYYDGTSAKYSTYGTRYEVDNLAEEDIFKLHAHGYKSGRIYYLGANLGVIVYESPLKTDRKYFYQYETLPGKRTKRFASCLSITFALAKEITIELNNTISKIPYEKRADYIIQVANQKIQHYHGNNVFPYPTSNKPKTRVVIDQKVIKTLFDNSKILFPFQDTAYSKSKDITYGHLYKSWLLYWSKGVKTSTFNSVRNMLNRYCNELAEYPINDLVDSGRLQSYIMSVYACNQGVGFSLYYRLRQILDFAVVLQIIRYNPLHSLKAILKHPPQQHFKTLDPLNLRNDIFAFFGRHCSSFTARNRVFIELLFYTLLRPSELARALKEDVKKTDLFNGQVLYIPNTKTNNPFIVPLCNHACRLLDLWYELCPQHYLDSKYIFPHARDTDKHMNINTVLSHMRYRGCNYLHLHGIRSCGASFFANHIDEVPYEVGMACLHHVYASPVHLSYDRTSLLLPRVKAMQLWGDFVSDSIGSYSILEQRHMLTKS